MKLPRWLVKAAVAWCIGASVLRIAELVRMFEAYDVDEVEPGGIAFECWSDAGEPLCGAALADADAGTVWRLENGPTVVIDFDELGPEAHAFIPGALRLMGAVPLCDYCGMTELGGAHALAR